MMSSELEKVIQGLTDICDEAYERWARCPYTEDKLLTLIKWKMPGAIAMLKELEPMKPIKKLGIVEPYKCGACGWVIGWESSFPLFCPKCGKKVDWDS